MHITSIEIDVSQRTGEVSAIANAGNFQVITEDLDIIRSLVESQITNDEVAITSKSWCDNAESVVRGEAFAAGVEQGVTLVQSLNDLVAEKSGSALEDADKNGYERGFRDGELLAQDMANGIMAEMRDHFAEEKRLAVLATVGSAGALGFHEAKQLMQAKIDEQLSARSRGEQTRRYLLASLSDDHLRTVRNFIDSFTVPGS